MLIAENIFKTYKKQNRPVLNGIKLEAKRGELVGIAGKNGSGKSTLLSVLVALLKPELGSVTLDGESIFAPKFSHKSKLGFVPQESTLFEELSVLDNINFWAAAYNKKYTSVFFDGADLKKKSKQLSGGMRKRLNIELGLIGSPEFLIMDEPTSALDIVYQQQIIDIMKALCAKNTGVIFTSHYADELWQCDKIGVIVRGVFEYYGKPDDFADKESFRDKLYKAIKEE